MAFEVARARSLYAEASYGIAALGPSGRITTLTASRLYSRILDEIEAIDFDVFRQRAHVTTARKVAAAPAILAAFGRTSRGGSVRGPAYAEAIPSVWTPR